MAARKPKPKGKKEAKELTPEEKKAKADALARKAEETRKKKQAANRAHIKKLKDVEDKYSRENLQKIHETWRSIMRAAKTTELHKDMETFSECYEHEVKRKDRIIANLMLHLSQAEKQREMAISKHLEILDGLMDTHQTRIKEMDEEFKGNLQRLEGSLVLEQQQILAAHERQKKELDDMVRAMENECKEAENESRQEFEASREEIKNKNTEEYNVLKISLERTIENLERKIEETHQAYLDSTESKTQAFKRMMEKDKITARLIEQRMRKLLRLHESIAYRRAKIATDSREWETRNRALRDQKDGMNKHYQSLKRKISKLRMNAHEELKDISKVSEEVKQDLKKKLDIAENILKLGKINSKLELDQERVFAFDPLYPFSFPPKLMNLRSSEPDAFSRQEGLRQKIMMEGKENTSVNINNSLTDLPHVEKFPFILVTDELGKAVEEFDYLSKFHNRYNKVMLDKMTLDGQKKSLGLEVENLKSSIKHFLEGFSGCDDQTIKNLKVIFDETGSQLLEAAKPSTSDDVIRVMRSSIVGVP